MNEEKFLEFSFSYIDEFGQESAMTKTVCANVVEDGNKSSFELLVENFKHFLLGCGFSKASVDLLKLEGIDN